MMDSFTASNAIEVAAMSLRAYTVGLLFQQKEGVDFSERAWQFCTDKGESRKIAYLTSLAVEEMGKNVIEHGFTKDKKDHVLNARIVHKEDELIIRMRDNCESFDPRKKYEQIKMSRRL